MNKHKEYSKKHFSIKYFDKNDNNELVPYLKIPE